MYGIDNTFLGNQYNIHTICRHFHLYLDEILIHYPNTLCQEFIVFNEAKILFN